MNKTLLYIASPYMHDDQEVVNQRYDDVSKATATIIQEFPDCIPFSPIAYTHLLQDYCETDVDWYSFDLEFLHRCDLLLVLTLDGWKESYGVNLEIDVAHKLDIPVIFSGMSDIVDVLHEYNEKAIIRRNIMAKRKNISSEIHSDEEYEKIEKACEERGITKAEFLREAVELALHDGPRTKALLASRKEERERFERRLKASEEIKDNLDGDILTLEINIEEGEALIKSLEQEKSDLDLQVKRLAEDKNTWRTELSNVSEHLKCLQNARSIIDKISDVNNIKDLAIKEQVRLQNELDVATEHFESMLNQRDKFKEKFEQATQALEKLKTHITEAQGQGVLSRIFSPKKLDLVQFRAETDQHSGESDEEGEVSNAPAEA